MSVYDDIMIDTGKNNKVILTADYVFTNTDCLFIEYLDVLKAPWFCLLWKLKDEPVLRSIINLSEFRKIESIEEAFLFYVKRNYRNPLLNFPLNLDNLKVMGCDTSNTRSIFDFCNDFMNRLLRELKDLYTEDMELNFMEVLKYTVPLKDLIKKIKIYDEVGSPYIKEDILNNFKKDTPEIVTGPFDKVIEDLPEQTTYVLSDIRKVQIIDMKGKLRFSDILLAEKFLYNYNDDNKYVVDIENLQEKTLFKFHSFNNIYSI